MGLSIQKVLIFVWEEKVLLTAAEQFDHTSALEKVVSMILLLTERESEQSTNMQSPSIFLKLGKVSNNYWKPVLKATRGNKS